MKMIRSAKGDPYLRSMLLELSVSNYALIDRVDLDLGEGLTIITGETGAGKSVILGALGLILGERVDTGVLQNADKKCVVEGKFDISRYGLEHFFESDDLDFDPVTTVRREVNPKGRSRAFINDTPVKLGQLKTFGSRLVDIHSQNETLLINDPGFQLEVVDAFAGNEKLLEAYREELSGFRAIQQRLSDLREQEERSRRDLDYYQFLYDELEKAELQEGEQEKTEEELDVLNNAMAIKAELDKAVRTLEGGEQNLTGSLDPVTEGLRRIASHHKELAALQERLQSVSIELKDIASDLQRIGEETEHDPQRIAALQERLDGLYQLEQKHQVDTVEELIRVRDDLAEKIRAIGSLEEEISREEEQGTKKEKKLTKLSNSLTRGREKAIPGMEERINALLPELGMKNASVSIQREDAGTFGENGRDSIGFYFTPGKGVEAQLLNKVMSGGERSRVMLAIKHILSEKTALPTMVLDEIDTGVSGKVADKLGELMKRISERMQVLSITHLPQVAGKGDRHFRAVKHDQGGRTVTGLQELSEEDRLEELASMLSGEELTQAAYENARELMKGATSH